MTLGSLGTQIYVPTTTVIGEPHALLVVGFDDTQNCWIVKNSWGGATWGDNGFGRIAYSANLLEPPTFFGVRGTNVDPNTKRRLSNGAMVRSGQWRQSQQLRTLHPSRQHIEHWWRDNGMPGLPWGRAGSCGRLIRGAVSMTGH